MRKWYKRYNENGLAGLADMSRKPDNSPNKKLNNDLVMRILELRTKRNIGARRIKLELFVENTTKLSLASIHKALKLSNVMPIKKLKRDKKFKRYQRLIAGDRVQIDTCKIVLLVYISIQLLMIVHGGVLWNYINAVQQKIP